MSRTDLAWKRRLVAGAVLGCTAVGGTAVALTVVAPASAADEPTVSLECTVEGVLADGTACVLPSPDCPETNKLADGTPCVLERSTATEAVQTPANDPTPEPTSEPTPEPTAEPTASPEPSAEPSGSSEQAAPEPAREEAKAEPGTPGPDDVGPTSEDDLFDTPGSSTSDSPGTTVRVRKRSAKRDAARARTQRDRAKRTRARQVRRARERLEAGHDHSEDFFTTDAPHGVVPEAAPEVPEYLIPLYKEAGYLYQVPWQILAAINEIESAYGRNLGPSSAGAVGWMQFMPATWDAFGLDADGDGQNNPNSPRDAIFAAASYLQASGAPYEMRKALFAYNHADWYVEAVLLRASQIGPLNPLVDRLVSVGARRVERRILKDERITIYGCGRRDIARHRIDRRVLLTLEYLASLDMNPTVSSLNCGHSALTKSGNISHHFTGTAVDISAINGVPISGASQGPGSITEEAVRALVVLGGAMRPNQIISLIEVEGVDNTYAMGDHADHIHIGWRPYPKQRRRALREWRERELAADEADREFAALIARKLRL